MLHQLSGLSSPPLSFTPLTIISSGQRDQDLSALREAAPSAVVRVGSRSSHRALTNRNTVLVLDRCGRMVYQQTLQQSNTNLQSIEAAILSAHLDEPCGPCHLPHPQQQEEPSRGLSDVVQDKTTSQAKMSIIANAYAPSSVDNHPSDDPRRDKASVEETRRDDSMQEEVILETTTTTRQPERKTKTKKKEKKNKRKKGKEEKREKKRKQEATTTTSTTSIRPEGCGVCETRDCECVATTDEDDEIMRLIRTSETANDVLGIRDLGYLAVRTSHSSDATSFLPSSRILWARDEKNPKRSRADPDLPIETIREERERSDRGSRAGSRIHWPNDKQTTRNKNGKESRADLNRDIKEGIVIVREDEELVEYPDDNVLGEIEKAIDTGRVFGLEESWRGVENGLSAQDRGGVGFGVNNDSDEEGLIAEVVVPDESSYAAREREEEEETRRETIGSEIVGENFKQDVGEKKRKKVNTFKDLAKNGKKEGEYKKVGKIPEEGGENFDWVGSDENDSQEFVLQWAEGEMEGDAVAERETEGDTVAEGEPEPIPRFATWREATIAPTVHDPSSSSDSDDRTRRVVVYESEGEDFASDKVEQLHSKVNPWMKGKHY